MSNLGPIENLVGKWVGTGNGWNIIAVPKTPTNASTPVKPGNPNNAILGVDFQLEVQQMNETISVIEAVQDLAPNKGGEAGQQNSYGAEYNLIATEVGGARLHFENGMWLNLVNPQGFTNQNTIARQACIPHGNSVLMMGQPFEDNGPPTINPIDPFPIDAQTGEKIKDQNYLEPYTQFTAKFNDIFGPSFNPNKVLSDVIANQDIVNTVTFDISTENNGGITNIPFGKNAEATSWQTTVWIETLKNGVIQMQYTQTIIIEFSNIKWPHINVNTLIKQ
jgi:hypothetical protein